MNKPELAHLINMINIAMIDGEISDEETTILCSIAESLGATKEEFDFCIKTAKEQKDTVIIEVPETDEEKTFYLKNLTLMMMSDGHIDENEKQYIKFIADKFGYDGDKALEILIDSVANDIRERLDKSQSKDSFDTRESNGPCNTCETGKKDDDIDKEQLQDEIREAVTLGKKALMKHDIPTAFDNLIYAAHLDKDACHLFLMIVNQRSRLFKISKEQVALLKDFAEKGYALSQYAYGRWLEAHRPEADSLNIANEYLKKADKGGVHDALFAQSVLYKAGHYGLVDREEAARMVNDAVDKGSFLAYQYVLRQTIYGWNNVTADPKRVADGIKDWFKDGESDDILTVNPAYYSIIAEAYAELKDKKNADKYYRKAIGMGYYEAWSDLCNLHFEDDEYDELLEQGCEAGVANCLLLKASGLMDRYEDMNSRDQKQATADIMHYTISACEEGSDLAPYFMGNAYYHGYYGFEKDFEKAWFWFCEGTKRDDGESYEMLAVMVSGDENPYEISDKEGFVNHCAMMALRNGNDNLLDLVVESYRNGELTDYAAEIERYYIPEYEKSHENDDEEDEDDDEEEYESDLLLIAIVKTDGKADIIEFDVENGWDELPDFVGANRLDAIRVQPLYDISNQLGYDDHITGWVDNMGLMKDLPMNPIGCKIYPGPIAGDMILTLEDKKYNPKSFNDLDELKQVIAALGAKLDNICLDDEPDDDGRYDAWS